MKLTIINKEYEFPKGALTFSDKAVIGIAIVLDIAGFLSLSILYLDFKLGLSIFSFIALCCCAMSHLMTISFKPFLKETKPLTFMQKWLGEELYGLPIALIVVTVGAWLFLS